MTAMQEDESRPRPSALRRALAWTSDTQRLEPRGAAGALIATLSVVAVLLICYLALVAHVTSHMQVSLFLTLL
ncbi:MAG TPA: hypothetical protein VIL72_10925, partial [Beijerinckiaceae bacterium]